MLRLAVVPAAAADWASALAAMAVRSLRDACDVCIGGFVHIALLLHWIHAAGLAGAAVGRACLLVVVQMLGMVCVCLQSCFKAMQTVGLTMHKFRWHTAHALLHTSKRF
jgi:hypothetical protein